MADKVKAKEWVAERIGKQYVIPTLGLWERAEDIDFDQLPDRFVLKCNHNSGMGMYICKDKSKMDRAAVIRGLKKGLAENYYLHWREWPYKNIPRRIIAEQYLEPNEGEDDLHDYKVLCFGGKAKLIEYHSGRHKGMHTQDFYDVNWIKQDIEQIGESLSEIDVCRPEMLDEMIHLSEVLAKDILHCRVDWYYLRGCLLFGEVTFYDGSGLEPFTRYKDDLLLGSWIIILDNK